MVDHLIGRNFIDRTNGKKCIMTNYRMDVATYVFSYEYIDDKWYYQLSNHELVTDNTENEYSHLIGKLFTDIFNDECKLCYYNIINGSFHWRKRNSYYKSYSISRFILKEDV